MTFTHKGFEVQAYGRNVTIEFQAKPPEDVLKALKANGYRWHGPTKTWRTGRASSYADLMAWIDKQINGEQPDGPCWSCQAPGKFRSYGAATPVLCDACHKIQAQG